MQEPVNSLDDQHGPTCKWTHNTASSQKCNEEEIKETD